MTMLKGLGFHLKPLAFCREHGSVKSTHDTHVQHRSPAMAA